MAKLTQLPKTNFSGLEFENIMEDVHNLIKENPEYNKTWDDFLNSNAGRVLTEVFAWITDQLATRIDWVANENFIGTATQRSSILRMLKLIGYKFSLPTSSTINVEFTFSTVIGEYNLTPSYVEGSGVFNPKTISAKDKDGNTKVFEALSFDNDNQRYSYKIPINIQTGTLVNPKLKHNINFYEGVTNIASFSTSEKSGQKFLITDAPIIRGSVVVYLIIKDGVDIKELELLEVDNFLNSKAQKASDNQGDNAIPYVLNVRDDDSVEIEFGPITLLPAADRRLPAGSELRVFYRVGGGIKGNIARQSINITEKYNVGGEDVFVSLKNIQEGNGGVDSESVEHAAYYGPLKMRTVGKAVTPEDYDILLSDHTSILLSKSYGYNNIPSDYYDRYGTYFNPLDVVSFVVVKKPGWETIPTSKYYLSNFGTFNLENRFNGKYFFNNGDFGNKISLKDTPLTFSEIYNYDNEGGREFKNFTVLQTSEDFKNSIFKLEDEREIANPEMKASITKTEYNYKINNTIDELTDHLVNDSEDPFFYGNELIGTDFPKIELKEDINAYFRSNKNVRAGVDISNGNSRFIINVDNQGDVIVDLYKNSVSPSTVPLDTQSDPYVEGIIDIINTALSSSYGVVYAYQDLGILIQDQEAYVENLENLDEEDYWQLGISGINYDINTGKDQTYTNVLEQINLAINPAGYQARFIQHSVNITCSDIRIERTNSQGTVILEDSNSAYDILAALDALPLDTKPIPSGDYSNVARKVEDINGAYVKLVSPNIGEYSSIVLRPPTDVSKTCLNTLFGLVPSLDEVSEYTCYGQRSLTVIYRDTTEYDFGSFIYEHGSCGFSVDDPDFVFLNYIKSTKEKIVLGSYFTDNFDESDSEWKPKDSIIYNAQWKTDPEDPKEIKELLDLDNSKILLKFTREEFKGNSIFVINDEYDIKETTFPILRSKNLYSFPDLNDKSLTISIDNQEEIMINLSSITNVQQLSDLLNDTFNEQANAKLDLDNNFCNIKENLSSNELFIEIKTDNKKTGKIAIIGSNSSANTLLFPDIADVNDNTIIYPKGDYYLDWDIESQELSIIKSIASENIPDVPFYLHYVADRRHIFKDQERKKIATDEDMLDFYMSSKKIAGVNNIFKRPVFTSFDFKAVVFCTKARPKEQIKYDVEYALKKAYSLERAEFNKPIIKSEVSKIIMDIPGVRYVEVSYFGKDMRNPETNVDNRLESGFDEVIVLSNDIFDALGEQIHGQELTYNVI